MDLNVNRKSHQIITWIPNVAHLHTQNQMNDGIATLAFQTQLQIETDLTSHFMCDFWHD